MIILFLWHITNIWVLLTCENILKSCFTREINQEKKFKFPWQLFDRVQNQVSENQIDWDHEMDQVYIYRKNIYIWANNSGEQFGIWASCYLSLIARNKTVCRGETIHLPHDTIHITIFHYDTVIFNTIRSGKIKLKRKHFPPKKVWNNKKLMLTINTKSFSHTLARLYKMMIYRSLILKGPKFREPRSFKWWQNFVSIMDSVEE
jgi:hypothetical protein